MKKVFAAVPIALLMFCSCKKSALSNVPDIESGLVVQYEFNNNLYDISGNNFNGYGDTAIDFVPDRFSKMNKAIRFNGGTHASYFMMPALGNQQVDSVFTVSCWFTLTTAGSSGLLYKADMTQGAESAYTLLLQNGKLRIIVGDGISKTKEYDALESIAANTWQHLALTVNGSQHIQVYVNGTEVYNSMLLSYRDDFNSVGFKTNGQGATGLLGGKAPYPLTNGKLDDFRLYRRALSAAEVRLLYEYEP
jgi:Concanavalin A-like lectin/glucanases superfamily